MRLIKGYYRIRDYIQYKDAWSSSPTNTWCIIISVLILINNEMHVKFDNV